MIAPDEPGSQLPEAPGPELPPGERWRQLPLGLMKEYRVQFEVFEGPLDLLLHLVKKQEVDIYQVNLTRIASEFVAYIDQMRELDLEVAGEFLVMAATLIFIKSRELLPADLKTEVAEEEDEEDPRYELIRRLVEYKKFKDAAARLQVREGEMECIYERRPGRPELAEVDAPRRAPVSVFDLIEAVSTILKRFNERGDYREIQADPYTVSGKMAALREMILARGSFRFSELFANARTRSEVVVTFLAMLELTRLRQLIVTQGEDFGEIEIGIAPLEPVAETAQPAPAEAVMAEEEAESSEEDSPAAPDSPRAPDESGAIPSEIPAAADSPAA